MLKNAPHYLNHWPLSGDSFSTDKTRVSITVCSHSPATCAVPFPPFGLRLGAERQEANGLLQPAREQRLQARPARSAAPAAVTACCRRGPAPSRPSPAAQPSEPCAFFPCSPLAPRPILSARNTTSATPAGPSAPIPRCRARRRAAEPPPPRPASPGRAHRPRRQTAPLPPRGGRGYVPYAGRGGARPALLRGGTARASAASTEGLAGSRNKERPLD